MGFVVVFLPGGDQLYMPVGKDLFYNTEVSNCTLTHSCVGRKKMLSQSLHQLNWKAQTPSVMHTSKRNVPIPLKDQILHTSLLAEKGCNVALL